MSLPTTEVPLEQRSDYGPNYLGEMFAAQRQLMAKYHEVEDLNGSPVVYEEEEGNLDNRVVQTRLHELFGFAVREWAEAMQELKLKPWTRVDRPTNVTNFIGEVGDTIHFFIEFCITAGMTEKDLRDAYFQEHKKNHNRLDSGEY
jgi:hypothetical protein